MDEALFFFALSVFSGAYVNIPMRLTSQTLERGGTNPYNTMAVSAVASAAIAAAIPSIGVMTEGNLGGSRALGDVRSQPRDHPVADELRGDHVVPSRRHPMHLIPLLYVALRSLRSGVTADAYGQYSDEGGDRRHGAATPATGAIGAAW